MGSQYRGFMIALWAGLPGCGPEVPDEAFWARFERAETIRWCPNGRRLARSDGDIGYFRYGRFEPAKPNDPCLSGETEIRLRPADAAS